MLLWHIRIYSNISIFESADLHLYMNAGAVREELLLLLNI